jgi:hypothetical protein
MGDPLAIHQEDVWRLGEQADRLQDGRGLTEGEKTWDIGKGSIPHRCPLFYRFEGGEAKGNSCGKCLPPPIGGVHPADGSGGPRQRPDGDPTGKTVLDLTGLVNGRRPAVHPSALDH